MKYSLRWIEEILGVKIPLTILELQNRITTTLGEVEECVDWDNRLRECVVGIVKELTPHPNASSLRLVTVEVGSNSSRTLVCGGSNLEIGQPVVVALPGARVRWHGEGDMISLSVATIRGIESAGMICAAEELGLQEIFPELRSQGSKEIVDLRKLDFKKNWYAGESLSKALYLDDIVIIIDNKTINNRPDVWGHRGLAREIAAYTGITLPEIQASALLPLEGSVPVHLLTDRCPFYVAVKMEISDGYTPLKLKARLGLCGERSIHPAVDAGNLTMLLTGQPVHVFDASKLRDTLKVTLGNNETFTTLDSREIEVAHEDIVIADTGGPVALAGIIGGDRTACSPQTSSVQLEAAYFMPWSVRLSSQRHSLRTSASARFEKNCDPFGCIDAARVWVEYIQQMYSKTSLQGYAEYGDLTQVNPPRILNINAQDVSQIAGVEISSSSQIKILESFGCKCIEEVDNKEKYKVSIPSWRRGNDLRAVEDIAEEIIRLRGIENITPRFPDTKINISLPDPVFSLLHNCTDIFVRDFKARELVNYAFVSENWAKKLGYEKVWKVANPIYSEISALRPSLVVSLLSPNMPVFLGWVFEIGRVFRRPGIITHPDEQGVFVEDFTNRGVPDQPWQCVALYRTSSDAKWPHTAFITACSTSLAVGESLGYRWKITPSSSFRLWQHPFQCASIFSEGKRIGYIAGIHPGIAVEINDTTAGACVVLNLSSVASHTVKRLSAVLPSVFPPVRRDFAILTSFDTPAEIVRNLIEGSALASTQINVELIDRYLLSEGVSTTWRLTVTGDKTFSAQELDSLWSTIENRCKEKGWKIR